MLIYTSKSYKKPNANLVLPIVNPLALWASRRLHNFTVHIKGCSKTKIERDDSPHSEVIEERRMVEWFNK